MKIGFDLDNIFINTPLFIPLSVIEKLYKKKANGELLYRIPGKGEQFIRKVSHHPLFRPAMPENISLLKALTKKEYDIYLISSRFGFLKNETKKIVARYQLSDLFTNMYFNYLDDQPHLFKDTIIRELGLDIYIDDDYHLLKYVAMHNKNTIFYWLCTNGTAKKLPSNMHQVTTLNQIPELSL